MTLIYIMYNQTWSGVLRNVVNTITTAFLEVS